MWETTNGIPKTQKEREDKEEQASNFMLVTKGSASASNVRAGPYYANIVSMGTFSLLLSMRCTKRQEHLSKLSVCFILSTKLSTCFATDTNKLAMDVVVIIFMGRLAGVNAVDMSIVGAVGRDPVEDTCRK